MTYDVVIIGSGPAGLSAAIYGIRAGLKTLVIEASPISGGQILNTYEIDNYPGLPKNSGMELAKKMREHADAMGAEFMTATVSEIVNEGNLKQIITNKETFEAKSIVIATGASHRKLGIPGENDLMGMGVSYCATCDGAFFRGKDVAVIGGGDVALEDAVFLSRACRKVYLIHRRDEFRGAKILQQQVADTENIEIIYDTIAREIAGEDMVEELHLYNKKKDEHTTIAVQGVFIAVGISPNTSKIKGLPQLDDAGYIVAGENGTTSIDGVFAAGDVRTKQLRQVITACADGANAITSAEKYLNGLNVTQL